jgi:hypothetical protein
LLSLNLGSDTDPTTGNLRGGAGNGSGAFSLGGLGKGVISGSVTGGSGNGSGGLSIIGTLKQLEITKDLIGGSSSAGPGGSADVVDSGFVGAGRIGALLIDGDVRTGTNGGTHLAGSAAIRAVGDITSLIIGGDLSGNATQRAVIAAGGAAPASKNKTIGALTINGDTSFADILGGYGLDPTGVNTVGGLTNADAQMGTVQFLGSITATNVVAGVSAGPDGRFGTADDEIPTGMEVTNDPAIRSRIAKLEILGAVAPNQEIFGVVAQVIASKNVTGDDHLLTDGNDDFEFTPAGSNFRLRELPG